MIINGNGPKDRRNDSPLDIFRRSLEDTVNNTKPNRSHEDGFGQVYNALLGHFWLMHNQHHALLWEMNMMTQVPSRVAVLTCDHLVEITTEDSITYEGEMMDLPPGPTTDCAVHTWMRAFSLASNEVQEVETQADPVLHLDALHKLWVHKYGERQVDRQQFVDHYDRLAMGIMRMGGYYIPRDLEALTITLGWKKRNTIKNNYLTQKHKLSKQDELNREELDRMVRVSGETQ